MSESSAPLPSAPLPSPARPTPPARPRHRLLVASLSVVVATAVGAGLYFGLQSDSMPSQNEAISDTSETPKKQGTWYISQMHPWIIQPEPGQCPICGMDLTPVDPDRFAGEMTIDPVVVQNMGIRIQQADTAPIKRTIRTVGVVTFDPARISDINIRFTGWVEKIHVQAQWDRVAANDPLFDMYSPELFSAEKEYAIAVKSMDNDANQALRTAARRRLSLLGIPEREIQRLDHGGAAQEVITITAPHAGIVVQKHINNGSRVTPQTLAYQIADTSQMWIEATIYEQHLPFVQTHQKARIQLSSGDRPPMQATIDYIYPVIDAPTRATKARFVVDNIDDTLKPNMFATVEIIHESRAMVRVPQEAVIGTGKRKIVFVSLGRGRFEPRDVLTGPRGGIYIGIQDGIQDGEQVVISGQFLLDSESKMREALAKVMKGDLASQQQPAPRSTGQQGDSDTTTIDIDPASMTAFKNTLDHYLQWQQSLYKNDLAVARISLQKFQPAFRSFLTTAQAFNQHIHHQLPPLASLQTILSDATPETLVEYRTLFSHISVELNLIIQSLGVPTAYAHNISGMRCSMAEGMRDGGVWLQYGPDVKNPYFGMNSDMRSCAADTWGYAAKKQTPEIEKVKTEINDKASAETDDKINAPLPQSALPSAAVRAYLAIQEALYMNDLDAAHSASKKLNTALSTAGDDWSQAEERTHGIMHATALPEARVAFGHISILLRDYFQLHGSTQQNMRVFTCGMARGIPEKGTWIQVAGDVKNPYFGHQSGMSDCAMTQWNVTATSLMEIDE